MASAVSSLFAPGSGNERFNQEAANWDKNQFVHDASSQASQAILGEFPALQHQRDAHKWDVLEIGCGTGLLSCMLAPHARRYVAVDAAQGMIDVLKTKLEKPDTPQNIVPVAVLLEDPEDEHLPAAAEEAAASGKRMKFDLITSHLVLHHIPDLKAVLATMLGCLKDGGKVALTDFEDQGPHSKRFHPQSRMGGVERHGIHRETMEALMNEVGFVNVRIVQAWSMDKTVEKFEGEFGDDPRSRKPDMGVTQNFPFVLCIGERKYCQTSDE
jgi:SAM-dependent methyltransferase